ncbi:MAG: FliH/SctL family protein [Planctomycetaceae bacterium]
MTTTITFRRSPATLLTRGGTPVTELPPVAAAGATSAAERNAAARLAEQQRELRELFGQLEEAISDVRQQQRNSLQELQQAAVELAVGAASWLVSAAIDRDHFAVDELVSQAIQQLGGGEKVRIQLNPADVRLLKQILEQDGAPVFGDDVEISEDATLKRGTCRAESPKMTIVADWEKRLQDIRTSWMESLDDAQVERRADDPAGRGFRRFPDRRETA